MVTTAWVFVLMSIHLGLHWAMFCGMAKKIHLPKSAKVVIKWLLRALVAVIAVYGVIVFMQRRFYEELFLTSMFKQFDYEKTVFTYLLESTVMSVAFVSASYYLKKLALKRKKQEKKS